MSLSSYRKVAVLILLCSISTYAQLVKSDAQIWEKSDRTLREVSKSKQEVLLNFHTGIKDKFLKKYIKHRKNKSHTLSLVHVSKEDEKIWENEGRNISLSNNSFKNNKSDKNIKLRKRPSIFTYVGNAQRPDGKSDSIRIKFEDRNLYEMIFIPRKAKAMDLYKIHSYLSIKYGISLEKGKYYASDGKVIWDPEKHGEFKHRPTGLGRDDGNELYQKQSSNHEDRFLTIGKGNIETTNNDNPSVFNENNFVIWSDDNKEMTLKQEKDFNVLERNWEINFIGSEISKTDYHVRINKSAINPDLQPKVYWIFLQDSTGNITKIQGFENENYVDFNKVNFSDEKGNKDFTHFTFAVSPLRKYANENTDMHSSSAGSDELAVDVSKIVLYPNPVKKDHPFTIRFPEMENLTIGIYDAGGRLVKMEKINSKSKSYSGSLHIQSSYLINMVQNRKLIKTFKLIVK